MTITNTAKIKSPGAVQQTPDLNKLVNLFVNTFPQLSVDDQHLSLKLYQLLAEGEPVSFSRLSKALGLSTDVANETLGQWPGVFYDESDRIVAFLGLSVEKTQHQLMVNSRTVYSWCAWDTLFIPGLLNTTVNISSICGASGEEVKLTVSPSGIESVVPGDAVMSFIIPDENDLRENITANFCHFVY
ncbi:MAG: organomercurial lyase, partial [Gammaproteobacteria bacterium]|nr:organomercurial lyase [Gammaproteobacteria bacterium]